MSLLIRVCHIQMLHVLFASVLGKSKKYSESSNNMMSDWIFIFINAASWVLEIENSQFETKLGCMHRLQGFTTWNPTTILNLARLSLAVTWLWGRCGARLLSSSALSSTESRSWTRQASPHTINIKLLQQSMRMTTFHHVFQKIIYQGLVSGGGGGGYGNQFDYSSSQYHPRVGKVALGHSYLRNAKPNKKSLQPVLLLLVHPWLQVWLLLAAKASYTDPFCL
jgi:hypothetical protein